jgi:anhydro-N-acetylmuramic acid kinase
MISLDMIRLKKQRRVIGLISGTSADGVDAALVEIREDNGYAGTRLIHALTMGYSPDLRDRIRSIDKGCVEELCELNYAVGEVFAAAALKVLEETGIEPVECDLIGSHGQTICHRPDHRQSSTLQIGEAAVIVERTGIATISDFRGADIAAGGEGAPLVPLADFYLFRPERGNRLLLNIGGIANLTLLTPDREGVRGFDTGPGNALIDLAVQSQNNCLAFDEHGEIARRGVPDVGMLSELMNHPYLDRKPPKSTGLDTFGKDFMEMLREKYPVITLEDFVATLTHFTAESIAAAIMECGDPKNLGEDIFVGGGGYHNNYLMEVLNDKVAPFRIRGVKDLEVPVDFREAIAFAILANETLEGRPGNLPAVTGARRDVVLGKISIPLFD